MVKGQKNSAEKRGNDSRTEGAAAGDVPVSAHTPPIEARGNFVTQEQSFGNTEVGRGKGGGGKG